MIVLLWDRESSPELLEYEREFEVHRALSMGNEEVLDADGQIHASSTFSPSGGHLFRSWVTRRSSGHCGGSLEQYSAAGVPPEFFRCAANFCKKLYIRRFYLNMILP
jgi:hypothetical protein